MADTVKSGVQLVYNIPLSDGLENTTRSLTLETDESSLSSALVNRATLFASQIEADYPALLQPTGWRDDNETASAFSIVGGSGAIEVKAVYKQEITIDRS